MRPESKPLTISDEARNILKILKSEEKVLLNDLKATSGLSNKKWDKVIKELTKKGLAKVEKEDNELFVKHSGPNAKSPGDGF